VDAAFARVREAVGPALDALVCAAGGFAATGPLDAEPDGAAALDALQRQLAINLTTAYLATRGALPLLRAPGRRPTGGDGTAARIVYVASAAVLPDGDPAGLAAYAAAKAGVLALMRAVAADERPRGDGAAGRRAVRANAVAPTAIRTAANAAAGMDPATAVTREAVAGTVAWLAASTSAPVTGQVLRLG
jgi:NAD(P)-dependent dehydrogenase (short-subunit alcohol dehydrogenase family)